MTVLYLQSPSRDFFGGLVMAVYEVLAPLSALGASIVSWEISNPMRCLPLLLLLRRRPCWCWCLLEAPCRPKACGFPPAYNAGGEGC